MAIVVVAIGCSGDAPPVDDPAPVPPDTGTIAESTAGASVFECEEAGFRFTVRPVGDSLATWLPARFDRPFAWLQRARAASGARYASAGIAVWMRETEATLEVAGETFSGCAKDRYASVWEEAKLQGIDFRAIGNEPGWIIDIRNGRMMHLRMDYGENEFSIPTPAPTSSDSATVYHAVIDSHQVRVTITPERCTDSMSGRPFESTVTAEVDGRTYHGCGRPLH